MSYVPYDKSIACPTDRVAWALCQIIDDDAPLRWTRYRGVVECIAKNPEVMADLEMIAGQGKTAQGGVTEAMDARVLAAFAAIGEWAGPNLTAALEAALSAEPANSKVIGDDSQIKPGVRVPEGWTDDAKSWGVALNDAAWTFTNTCPEKSALLFNTCKTALRAAILTYAEKVAATPQPRPRKGMGRRWCDERDVPD